MGGNAQAKGLVRLIDVCSAGRNATTLGDLLKARHATIDEHDRAYD
jgi:hypothetical protein